MNPLCFGEGKRKRGRDVGLVRELERGKKMNGEGEEDEQESDAEEGSEDGSDETDEIVEEGDDL